MDDEHLVNTIRWLRRRNWAARFHISLRRAMRALSYAATAPDGAADAAHDYANGVMTEAGRDEILAEKLPVFGALLAEAENRGLDIRGRSAPRALDDVVDDEDLPG